MLLGFDEPFAGKSKVELGGHRGLAVQFGVHVAPGYLAYFLHILHHLLQSVDAELVLQVADCAPHAQAERQLILRLDFFVAAPRCAPL